MGAPVEITVPSEYGYVVIGCVLGPSILSFMMGGPVMKARKKYNVQYPNLYATPGFHKNADEFNRVQRGHQAVLESLPSFVSMSLVAGVAYPITIAANGLLFCVGSWLFQKGYGDLNLDVKDARYKKGGMLFRIAQLVAMGAVGRLGVSMLL
uniref:Microsomal glutathione S-transferase 3 n=1 Tax=Pseudictyota dubia TaxID=2749911 RepID=A0A7R9VS57_9STRA|mmetsp:Transcript_20815/g.39021  ORF Transcript_20815/g.39021 Transcript_20815/m.39021 type:complete len:152 (+) Transcript_20815:152-607(+)|eukprot:CAMPEP_0197437950 /NCGR_PEP_ID=MMETSP1175-20131217/5076_1 /TAXON_ID=1003142 /ORGANISM="Triceratium dubium, Strain CCMP147" /LENGTH=151 /DNA_ID=CAMNT_0042967593 /DNA_START=149 /DNA_END=604 /DNA_ORIENTATION=+